MWREVLFWVLFCFTFICRHINWKLVFPGFYMSYIYELAYMYVYGFVSTSVYTHIYEENTELKNRRSSKMAYNWLGIVLFLFVLKSWMMTAFSNIRISSFLYKITIYYSMYISSKIMWLLLTGKILILDQINIFNSMIYLCKTCII